MKQCRLCQNEIENKRRTCDDCKAKLKQERWERYYSNNKDKVLTRMREYEQRPHRKESLSKRYQQMIGNARNAGRDCSITREQFAELTNQPCYYCQDVLCNIRTGSRIDRLDNSKGYELDNVVACCKVCNAIKQDLFTAEETLAMVQALLQCRAIKQVA